MVFHTTASNATMEKKYVELPYTNDMSLSDIRIKANSEALLGRKR